MPTDQKTAAHFGKMIARLRGQKVGSQDDLAQASALSKGTIQNIEKSAGFPRRHSTFIALAKSLGMTSDELTEEWLNESSRAGKAELKFYPQEEVWKMLQGIAARWEVSTDEAAARLINDAVKAAAKEAGLSKKSSRSARLRDPNELQYAPNGNPYMPRETPGSSSSKGREPGSNQK